MRERGEGVARVSSRGVLWRERVECGEQRRKRLHRERCARLQPVNKAATATGKHEAAQHGRRRSAPRINSKMLNIGGSSVVGYRT